MPYTSFFLLNAVLGAMAVGGGLWLLSGGLSPAVMAMVVVGLVAAFAKLCPGVAHVWLWSTALLGMESLAWPVPAVLELQQFGPEPPLEAMSRVFTAVLFGVLSGIFWLTFAWGLYRRTRPPDETTPLTPGQSQGQAPNQAKARRRKKP